jgi:hypothetical protein
MCPEKRSERISRKAENLFPQDHQPKKAAFTVNAHHLNPAIQQARQFLAQI